MEYVELAGLVIVLVLAANAWRTRGLPWALAWLVMGAVVWVIALAIGRML